MSDDNVKVTTQDTYSAKTTTDIKDKIEGLRGKTGLNSKEFLEAMVLNMEKTLSIGNDSEQTEDMQQIRYHLSRADSLFLGLVQKNTDLKNDYTTRIAEENALHKSIVDDLQREKAEVQAERDLAVLDKTAADGQLKNILDKNIDLEETNRLNRSTIDILTRKNEELEAQIASVDKLKQIIQELQKTSQEQLNEITALSADKGKLERMVEAATDKLSQIEKNYTKAMEEQQRTQTSQIEQLKELHRLELDKASVETERRALEARQEVRNEYVELLKENKELAQQIANIKAQLVEANRDKL